jgi:glutamate:GABA antiporter
VQSSRRLSAHLSIFSLVMITVGSVDSVRNLPATALFGSSLIFFFLAAAIFFLIPCALVSAELASTWTEEGGIFVWVSEAFGQRAGFIAVWLQWVENLIWYPTILSFVAGTVAYVISPQLAENRIFLMSVILIAFWGATIVNLYGIKSSAWFSNICGTFGLLLPMGIIISLGAFWLFSGNPLAISLHPKTWLPDLSHPNTWVSLTGIMLSYCGMEIATVHARDVDNPQRAFPIALFIATFVIFFTLALGSLAIAIVLPQKDISLVSGLMEAYQAFLSNYHMAWFLPVVAVMLILGAMGSVSNWIIAPTRGLLISGEAGCLPQALCELNRFQAPKVLLLLQAIVVTVVTSIFLFLPSVNGAYWFLTVLAAQLYMLMYMMMFLAGICLRIKARNRVRIFQIPGGFLGMLVVAGMGLFGVALTFVLGFIPPTQTINIGSAFHYEVLLVLGLIVMILPAFWIARRIS